MGIGAKLKKKIKRVASKARSTYSSVAETRPGQIGIAIASFANPISASVQAAAPAYGATGKVFSTVQKGGAVNSLLTRGARRTAAATFGPYFVSGANSIVPGSGTAAVKLASTGLLDDIPIADDLIGGFFGTPSETTVGDAGAFGGSVAHPDSALDRDPFPVPPLVMVAVGVLVAVAVVIYLRK